MAPLANSKIRIRSTKKKGTPVHEVVIVPLNDSQETGVRFFAPPVNGNDESPLFLEPHPSLCYNIQRRR